MKSPPDKIASQHSYINEYTNLHPKEKRQLLYKRKYKHDAPTWDDSMVLLRDLLAQTLPESCTVLDTGCGHGNFIIDELRGRFSRAVGIDVSPDVMTNNISLDTCVVGSMASLPFDTDSFDLVTSLWVLEHIDEPQICFDEIYRVLKPSGVFAFTTPNTKSPLIWFRRMITYHFAQRLVRRLYGRTEDDTFDVRYQANSIHAIQKLAEKSGFEISFLKENEDPSYTSFGPISYFVSKSFSQLPFSFAKPHIVGILKKRV